MSTSTHTNFLISCISGALTGVITDISYFPLDSLKTRVQASCPTCNYSQTTRNISSFRGITPIAIISFPSTFLFMFTYEGTKTLLIDRSGAHPSLAHFIAGGLGEVIQNLIRNPFEVVKQQMQVGLDPTTKSTVLSIYKYGGLGGFFAGFWSTCIRDAPCSAITFAIYEYLKKLTRRHNNGELPLYYTLLNGAVASGIGGYLTTPFDVIKTRLMIQRSSQYKGMWDCGAKICKEEGFGKLFSAASFRTLGMMYAGVVFFGAYEEICKILSRATQVAVSHRSGSARV
eukprot:TRINITY_DN9669_c0_g1_i3.p1 TRINITY_DN9669_c0_g1~~TRINITY_DN9669_c0_g1_i3.p1  ORF type:complete len:286 (-),score=8.43 TRINITY_DN9669_c0_g1_i3:244-1101(-)